MALNILFDPEWVKETANPMPTGICFYCQGSFKENELNGGFCKKCDKVFKTALSELGDE